MADTPPDRKALVAYLAQVRRIRSIERHHGRKLHKYELDNMRKPLPDELEDEEAALRAAEDAGVVFAPGGWLSMLSTVIRSDMRPNPYRRQDDG